MSGSTGNEKIQGRDTFARILETYKEFLAPYPLLVNGGVDTTGSYNSDQAKTTFGDMDLVVNLDYTVDEELVNEIGILLEKEQIKKRIRPDSTVIKGAVKKHLAKWLMDNNDGRIVAFVGSKKMFGNTGELITISFQADNDTPPCQIDNMVALDETEFIFKKEFLDMAAAKQGLMLGLVKTAMQEDGVAEVLQRIGLDVESELPHGTEYEFNLSSKELTLRRVEYDIDMYDQGDFKEVSRKAIKTWTDFSILEKLLGNEYKLTDDFETLIEIADKKLKNPRSRGRVLGVFKSMITVKKGELGKPKGDAKLVAIKRMEDTFGNGQSSTPIVEESRFAVAARFLKL
jgi:hypothetical protein